MCEIDFDGRCDFSNATHQTARKPHRCVCCSAVVAPGERYLRESGKWEGELFSDACCMHCEASRDQFAEAHGATPFANSFVHFLHECIIDDESPDPRWAATMRHIDRRRRAAA